MEPVGKQLWFIPNHPTTAASLLSVPRQETWEPDTMRPTRVIFFLKAAVPFLALQSSSWVIVSFCDRRLKNTNRKMTISQTQSDLDGKILEKSAPLILALQLKRHVMLKENMCKSNRRVTSKKYLSVPKTSYWFTLTIKAVSLIVISHPLSRANTMSNNPCVFLVQVSQYVVWMWCVKFVSQTLGKTSLWLNYNVIWCTRALKQEQL